MANEFKVKNGLLVETSGSQVTGSLFVSGGVSIYSSGSIFSGSSTLFSIDGASGRLFQVDDSLSGSLYSVNTVAGLPVLEVFSDNTVRIGQFGRRALYVSQSVVGIGKETALNGVLDVSGSVFVTGSLNATSFTGSLLGTASFTTSASYAQTASIMSNIYYATQSKGGTFYNSAGLSTTDTGSVIVWRAPYNCTASTIYAWREGGTAASVSASRNGLALTSSNMVLTNASQFYSSSATQNQNFSTGDRLEVAIVSFTGTVTEVSIQVDFRQF